MHWEWNARAKGVPWIAAGPAKSRLEGVLFSLPLPRRRTREPLGGRRPARGKGGEDRVVLEEVGRQPHDDQRQAARRPRLVPQACSARRLAKAWYPSGITMPAAGCWELTLRTDGWTRRLVVKAVDPAPEGTCDATPVGADNSARVSAFPVGHQRSSGRGKTHEGGALLYAGGKTPTGGNTKVLWRGTAARWHARRHGLAARRTGNVPPGVQGSWRTGRATGPRSSSFPSRAAGS